MYEFMRTEGRGRQSSWAVVYESIGSESVCGEKRRVTYPENNYIPMVALEDS